MRLLYLYLYNLILQKRGDQVGKYIFSFPGKNGDLYNFDVAESKNGKQYALPPTTVKGERFKAKKYFLIKKGLINFKNDMYSST